jgi:hypothetical protein
MYRAILLDYDVILGQKPTRDEIRRAADEEHQGDCCELFGAEHLESGYWGCEN